MTRKLIFLFAVLWLTVFGAAAQIAPTFSTEASPVWYQVQFVTGSHTLKDNGASQNLVTATIANEDAQKWQLIGNANSFILKSKLGRYVSYNGSRYTSVTSFASATPLTITPSTAAGADECWEIGRIGVSNKMNQFGGTSVGVQLGEWTAGDNNNPLRFIATSAIEPKFATTAADASAPYYFISFLRSNFVICDNGAGVDATQGLKEPGDGSLWKLVGNASGFQMVNKAGRYATVKGTGNDARLTSATTPDASGFTLVATTNSTYPSGWEIQAKSISGTNNRLNQWTGIGAGKPIGFWSAGDMNNPLEFIDEKLVKYPDYKVVGSTTYRPESKLSLWYTTPATLTGVGNKWMEYSLPIGNGQLGASLFNGVQSDQILINEKTLWQGASTDNGGSYGDYLNFGSVYAEMLDEAGFGYTDNTAAKDYYRTLDLSKATGVSGFTSADGSVTYKREYIASNPDGVIAMRISASKPGSINQKYYMEVGKPGLSGTVAYSNGEGTYSGKLRTIAYDARMKVVATGGTMTTGADGVVVKGADEVLVIIKGATDFDPYTASYTSGKSQETLASEVSAAVTAAANKGWDALYNAHVADYQKYFNRVSFNIEGTTNEIPTNSLVDAYSTSADPAHLMLEELYFNYGRYLEISSSRGVDLPSNLQGIWNNLSAAPWHSDIHANINVQMNYWPAEATNLSEMHVPFLNYITNMAINQPQWQKYAKDSGQTKGWTCYTENNIFGGVGSFLHNYVVANAWYCTHLWQHYRYTLDKTYLAKVFPAMWSATEYWLERLKLDTDGKYVCPQEYSPEQGPTQDGVAHAQQLVRDLFENTLKAAEILGSNVDLTTLRDRLSKLDTGLGVETYTGNWGTTNGVNSGDQLLREWKYSAYTTGEQGHRHMSHLMAVYPFNQIKPGSEYFTPAVNSMKLRGDASTGWSMGWKINLWARLLNGDRAHGILKTALRHSTAYNTDQSRGGIYYNLFDSHSPFQIDGNFGSCAGVAEMLLQSQNDELHLCPALPSAWMSGSITGLKAIGDFTVDVKWVDGGISAATIISNQGQPLKIRNEHIKKAKFTINGVAATPKELTDETATFDTKAGDRIELSFTGTSSVIDVPAQGENGTTIVPLTTLQVENIVNGYGTTKVNKSIDGNAITLKGNVYKNGLGLHAPATIVTKLNGAVTSFHAVLGMDDEVLAKAKADTREGVATYSVRLRRQNGTEKVVVEGTMGAVDANVVNIDITEGLGDYKYLILDFGTGDYNWSDHVDVACGYFEYKEQNSTRPEIVSPDVLNGSLACATVTFSQPGVKYMHKIRTNDSTDEISVTDLPAGLTWNAERKLVEGMVQWEGEYVYNVVVSNGGSSDTYPITLTVSSKLQQPTPFMGWLSWNVVEGNISENVVRTVSDAMVSKGLLDAGYNYLVIDDLWHASARAAGTNKPVEDPAKFPNGMKACADYAHSKGLKFGIYSDAGNYTCAGKFGSFGYEVIDAQQYAEWGVDLLKYDYCNAPSDAASAKARYKAMGDALKDSGRNILFYACEWGVREPWKWASEAGATCWRCTYDTRDCWVGKTGGIGMVQSVAGMKDLWPYSGVNRFNDADMMCVAIHGTGKSSSDLCQTGPGMTQDEYRSQFAMWCMWSSPLTLSFDLTKAITDEDLAIITNRELIAVNQDAMGQAAEFLGEDANQCQLYAKDLENGDVAVAVINMSGNAVPYTIDFSKIAALKSNTEYAVRNLQERKDEAAATNSISIPTIKSHETKVYRLTSKANVEILESDLARMTVTPGKGMVKVCMTGTGGAQKRVVLSDLEGRVIGAASGTETCFDIPVSVVSGAYIARVVCQGKTTTIKFMM